MNFPTMALLLSALSDSDLSLLAGRIRHEIFAAYFLDGATSERGRLAEEVLKLVRAEQEKRK